MASQDEQRSGLADAAGRAAFFPARAAARAWREQLEAAVDEMLSAPEIARVIDRALAGPLPEEIVRREPSSPFNIYWASVGSLGSGSHAHT